MDTKKMLDQAVNKVKKEPVPVASALACAAVAGLLFGPVLTVAAGVGGWFVGKNLKK